MSWIIPKVDWTEDDYFNYNDLNRIENNTDVINILIGDFMGKGTSINTKTDWNYSSIPFSEELNRIEENIQQIAVFKPTDFSSLTKVWIPGLSFDYKDANRYEKNLQLLYKVYEGSKDTIYCIDVCMEGI